MKFLSRGDAVLYSSPLYCAKHEFTNSIPSLSWDCSLGEFAEMLHSYVLFMTKYAFLTSPLSESGIVIASSLSAVLSLLGR